MKNRWLASIGLPALALFALGASPASEGPGPDVRDTLTTPERITAASADIEVTGRLWVTGGSTVRSWECEAGRTDIRVRSSGGADLAPENLETAVSGLEVHVSAPEMDCDNNTMNDHMWDALKAREHGWISFRMTGYQLTPAQDADTGVRIRGTLEMIGETRDVVLNATLHSRPDGSLQVRGVHELNMTEWGIRPPRLMMGTLRVHEDVQIHMDLNMRTAEERR